MRWPRLLGVAVFVLTGCQAQESTSGETPQETRDRDAFGEAWERMRHTPLESEVAINDEYGISAVFPKGSPVCTADSGGHIHGFFQWLEDDCTREAPGVRPDRYLSVWADYNAAEYSRDEAVEVACSDATRRDVFDVTVPEGRGWAASCLEAGDDGTEQFIVMFLPKEHEADGGFGPDNIGKYYTMRLYTDAAHREADLRTFETFLRRLKLAGTALTLAS